MEKRRPSLLGMILIIVTSNMIFSCSRISIYSGTLALSSPSFSSLFNSSPLPPRSPPSQHSLTHSSTTTSNRDLAFVLTAFYLLFSLLLPSFGPTTQITLAFLNALAWRVFHSFGLGWALKLQSEKKWVVRHFLKHYHYEAQGEVS